MFNQIYLEESFVKQQSKTRIRRLFFSGAKNLRDLGGYRTIDNKTVRWEALYRSDGLNKLTDSDLRYLSMLDLNRVIDFRAKHEMEREPDRLPHEIKGRRVEIPILDGSTKLWHDSGRDFVNVLRNIKPAQYMIQTNVELATKFTPEMQQFISELMSSNGKPILFHCAAGKDRTGFAAAILLRILGVPQETVMEDYLLTNRYFFPAHRWNLALLRVLKGNIFADSIKGFMEARAEYLTAAFNAIDQIHGSFEDYVYKALDLSVYDTERLRALYLE